MMRVICLVLVVSFLCPHIGPIVAVANSQEAPKAPESDCPLNRDMSLAENSAYLSFNARLTHLMHFYGRPEFESRLEGIVLREWPKERLDEVSPLFYERVQNLVDQARLKHAVAKTIGLKNKAWVDFEWLMRNITLLQSTGHNLSLPLDKTAENLIRTLGKYHSMERNDGWQLAKAEAVLRATDMSLHLLRWRVINGSLIDERAAASGRKLIVIGIGAAGAGIIIGTTLFAAPVVLGAGTAAGGLSTSPVIAALLVKLGEVGAGAGLGMIGAPAVTTMLSSYQTLTEASRQSNIQRTSFACEMGKQITKWKDRAPNELLTSAVIGTAWGAGGGIATFHPMTAKLVLYATGLGVGAAQLYAVGKMGQKTLESLAHYRMAQEAEMAGDFEGARAHLQKSRDLANEAGEKGLESVIIGVLAVQIRLDFRRALREGAGAIRKIWAAASDTVPSAGDSLNSLVKGE